MLSKSTRLYLELFWFLPPFGSHFGRCVRSPNGGQGHQKAISTKTFLKNGAQNETTLVPKGSQNGANKSKMRSSKHLVSRVAPKWPPEPLQDRFWRGFGTIVGPCSLVFSHMVGDLCKHSVAACCKQKRPKSRGVIRKKQAERV